MTYAVLGHTTVTVSIEVEADSYDEAIEAAYSEFGGVFSFAGNGGCDKLIGVDGSNEYISADGEVVFDDAMEVY